MYEHPGSALEHRPAYLQAQAVADAEAAVELRVAKARMLAEAQELIDHENIGGVTRALRLKREALSLTDPEGVWYNLDDADRLTFGAPVLETYDSSGRRVTSDTVPTGGRQKLVEQPTKVPHNEGCDYNYHGNCSHAHDNPYAKLGSALSLQQLTNDQRAAKQSNPSINRNKSASEAAADLAATRIFEQEGTFESIHGHIVCRNNGDVLIAPDTAQSREALAAARFTERGDDRLSRRHSFGLPFNALYEYPLTTQGRSSNGPNYQEDPAWRRMQGYWWRQKEAAQAQAPESAVIETGAVAPIADPTIVQAPPPAAPERPTLPQTKQLWIGTAAAQPEVSFAAEPLDATLIEGSHTDDNTVRTEQPGTTAEHDEHTMAIAPARLEAIMTTAPTVFAKATAIRRALHLMAQSLPIDPALIQETSQAALNATSLSEQTTSLPLTPQQLAVAEAALTALTVTSNDPATRLEALHILRHL